MAFSFHFSFSISISRHFHFTFHSWNEWTRFSFHFSLHELPISTPAGHWNVPTWQLNLSELTKMPDSKIETNDSAWCWAWNQNGLNCGMWSQAAKTELRIWPCFFKSAFFGSENCQEQEELEDTFGEMRGGAILMQRFSKWKHLYTSEINNHKRSVEYEPLLIGKDSVRF